jgi:hypothetical protein
MDPKPVRLEHDPHVGVDKRSKRHEAVDDNGVSRDARR